MKSFTYFTHHLDVHFLKLYFEVFMALGIMRIVNAQFLNRV